LCTCIHKGECACVLRASALYYVSQKKSDASERHRHSPPSSCSTPTAQELHERWGFTPAVAAAAAPLCYMGRSRLCVYLVSVSLVLCYSKKILLSLTLSKKTIHKVSALSFSDFSWNCLSDSHTIVYRTYIMVLPLRIVLKALKF
jgi:hypothetical protein